MNSLGFLERLLQVTVVVVRLPRARMHARGARDIRRHPVRFDLLTRLDRSDWIPHQSARTSLSAPHNRN